LTPYRQDWLPVGDGHLLYFEEVGAPDGVPVVFLHGGPGSGCKPEHRDLFADGGLRGILFDQRGCGRSTPLGGITANTTAHLIDDLEALRRALGIERWIVCGGSWGTTLALCYALEHRAAVAGLALRGIFLASPAEIAWFLDGLGGGLPAARAALDAALTPEERANPIRALGYRAASADFSEREAAARAWLAWEAATMDAPADPAPGPTQLAKAVVQLHYLAHGCFLDSTDLLRRLPELAGLPTIIVQGGQDRICPPHTAQSVAAAIPGAELHLLADEGHSGLTPPMVDALRAALVRLVRLATKYRKS
jgi:proline iminopeptidase